MTSPLSLTSPSVGSISFKMHLPTVDLPHPDSPTSPKVSPCLIEKETPSTAKTWPETRLKTPLRMGKCFLRSVTSSSGPPLEEMRERARSATTTSATYGLHDAIGVPACGKMARHLFLDRRVVGAAFVGSELAARRGGAAGRHVLQGRHPGRGLPEAGAAVDGGGG